MSVQMLQGWYDQISPALDHIGSAAMKIINPNYDIQQELKKKIAADPTIIQQLIDNENMNPGSTVKTFGSQAESLVKGKASSSKATVEKAARDAYAGGRTTEDLVNDKTALGNATTRDVTGSNQSAYKTTQANEKIVASAADLADEEHDYKAEELKQNFPLIAVKANADKATLDTKIKQTELESKNISLALDAMPQLKGIKSNALAKKFVESPESMSPQEQAQAQMLQTNEATKTLWGQQVQNYQHIRQLNYESGWHNSAEKQGDRQLRSQAFTIARDLNMPGNINAVMAYMTDPQAAQKAEALASGQVKPETNFDQDLKEIAQGIQQKQELKYTVAKTHAYSQIQAGTKIIRTAKDVDRPAIEAQINDALQTINSANGSNITYKYQDKSFAKDESGFYVMQPDGKEKKLSDEEFGKIAFSKSMGSNSESQALDAWRTMAPAQREEALRKLDPATAQRIRDGLVQKKTKLGGSYKP